jgi:hypothetical protein
MVVVKVRKDKLQTNISKLVPPDKQMLEVKLSAGVRK